MKMPSYDQIPGFDDGRADHHRAFAYLCDLAESGAPAWMIQDVIDGWPEWASKTSRPAPSAAALSIDDLVSFAQVCRSLRELSASPPPPNRATRRAIARGKGFFR